MASNIFQEIGDGFSFAGATLGEISAAVEKVDVTKALTAVAGTASTIVSAISEANPAFIPLAAGGNALTALLAYRALATDKAKVAADTATTPSLPDDIIAVQADALSVIGGLNGLVGTILGTVPLTKPVGILFDAFGLYCSAASLELAFKDPALTLSLNGANSVLNVTNNGTIIISNGGSLDVSSAVDPMSAGVFQLQTKGTLEIAAILGSGLKIQFLGSNPANELIIDKAASFGTSIGTGPLLENFAAGDIIDLKGIANTGLGLGYSAASGDLQVTGSTGSHLATLVFQNSTLGGGTFHTTSDGAGGTLITHS